MSSNESAIPNHDGSPRAPDDALFGAPPPQLGTVLSASTGLRKKGPKSWRRWRSNPITGAIVGAVLGVLAAPFVISRVSPGDDGIGLVILAMPLGLLVGLGFGFWTRLRPEVTCTYVATNGLARFVRKGKKIIRTELLDFNYVHDVQNTRDGKKKVLHRCLWLDKLGRRLFFIAGKVRVGRDESAEHPTHFATAGHAAWEAFASTSSSPEPTPEDDA